MIQTLDLEPPRRREFRLLLIAGGVVCAVLIAVYFVMFRTTYAVLFSDLRTMDAATIVAELDKEKIPYRLEQGGTRILVPSDLVDSTRLNVTGADLPLKGQVGFELFNQSDMGLTDFAQKINYQRALQGELARTIMTMEPVETARIHLSLSDRTIFRDDRVPPKASVTVVPRAGHRITQSTVVAIQRIVAAAVSELDPANVVVIEGDGQVVSSDPAPVGDLAGETAGERGFERQYEVQVRGAIAGLVPDGAASIRVQAGPARDGVQPTGTEGAAEGGASANRNFPLRVTVSLTQPLGHQIEEEIKTAASASLGLDPANGDLAVVTVAPPVQTVAAPAWTGQAADASPARAPVEAERSDSSFGYLPWLVGGLAGLLLIAVAILRRARGPLSEQERADFVSRFRTLLEAEEASA